MSRIIPLRDYFVFNGRSSLEFKVRISGNGTYKTAERDVESIVVPGRNGELTVDRKRFKNVAQYYDAFIVDDYQTNLSSFINHLFTLPGYQRLEDSYHLEEFRLARFLGPMDPESVMDESGRFRVEFDCKPQRYLKSGEREIVIEGSETITLINPSMQTALPKITVTSGTGEMIFNNQHVTLSSNNGATIIDSELMDAYEGTTNRSANLTLTDGYPVLNEGSNGITIPAGMTVKLRPRWWKI